jgi:hypothetical protein
MNVAGAARKTSWKGAWQIVRFNWPSYALSFVVIVICAYALQKPWAPQWLLVSIVVSTIYFSAASLIASHWVYDLSPWAGSSWLADLLPPPRGRVLMVQTGFDSSEGRIQQQLGPCDVTDLYGTPGIGGATVRRARRASAFDQTAVREALPAGPAAAETIVAAFALHEIRDAAARRTFFIALEHALVPQGRLLVVEHLRDWKNFLVFGLGFLHFLPAIEWKSCAAQAGLKIDKERSMTPFVRVFLWRKV